MKITLRSGLTTCIRGLIRYDFGQTLEIYNTNLNINNVEFQFIQNGVQIDQLGVYNQEFDCYKVSVPDKFLQNSEDIECYLYIEDTEQGKTKKVINFSIYDREMYDPVPDEKTKSLLAEVLEKLNDLQEQLNDFQLTEEQLESVMAQVIKELSSDYYTAEETDGKIEEAISKIDLSNYVTGRQMSEYVTTIINSLDNKYSMELSYINKKLSENTTDINTLKNNVNALTDTVNTLKEEVEASNAVLETI